LKEAIKKLEENIDIIVKEISAAYQTEPVGYTEQDDFLNLVVKLETSLTPLKLLNYTQKIEEELDRVREIRWGPRTIDIDIILFGSCEIDSERLTVPHPLFQERAFVLVPLSDLTTEKVYKGKTALDFLNQLPEKSEIKKYKENL
jgi:2-amino-4-hydroxy-6-hydroxymethyldihydropteridine diphosphokinase